MTVMHISNRKIYDRAELTIGIIFQRQIKLVERLIFITQFRQGFA